MSTRHPPTWTPLAASADRALHRQQWTRRHGLDDWGPAPGATAPNCRWERCPDGVPWAVLAQLWMADEASERCVLCGGPLAAVSFGFALSMGQIRRDCLACEVSHAAAIGSSGVRDWLVRNLTGDLRPTMSLRFGGPRTRGDRKGGQQQGTWTRRRPRRPGTYLVTQGTDKARRAAELDELARPVPDAFDGWWWRMAMSPEEP